MSIIRFSEWQLFKKYDNYEFKTPEYKIDGDRLSMSLPGGEYISSQFDSVTYDVKPGYVYEIQYNLDTDNDFMRVIYGWYQGNKAVVKGYLNFSGDNIVCPDNAEYLKITIRFNGFNKCKGEISGLNAICLGEYKEKTVNLSAVAIPHIYYPESQPPEYNLNETIKAIDRLCSRHNPDIIALTETFYTRKTLRPLPEMCNPIDCEVMAIMRKKAREYNTYLAFSFHEEENGHFYNSGILINRKGEIVGKCHKCHLTMAEYESGMTPGNEIKVFDTEIGKIGIAICWDIFFPEHIREMQKQGVDIIINPTAGYSENKIKERATECGSYIVTATASGFEKTAIFNPFGDIIANASNTYGYVFAPVDLNKRYYNYYLSYPANTQSRNIYLNEARFDLYNK